MRHIRRIMASLALVVMASILLGAFFPVYLLPSVPGIWTSSADARIPEFFWRHGLIIDADRCRSDIPCFTRIALPVVRHAPTLGEFVERVGSPDKTSSYLFQDDYIYVVTYGFYIARGVVIRAKRLDNHPEITPDMSVLSIELWKSRTQEGLMSEYAGIFTGESPLGEAIPWSGFGHTELHGP